MGSYCPPNSTSSNECALGHYCPSTSEQIECGSLNGKATYCGVGSVELLLCEQGFFCPSPFSMIKCGDGAYCHEGSHALSVCSAGKKSMTV